MRKKLFPVDRTNENRAKGGSVGGIAGREFPVLLANRLREDASYRHRICRTVGRAASSFMGAAAGSALKRYVPSVLPGKKTQAKTTLRLFWKDGSQTNIIVKKAEPAQICLKKAEAFIPEFEARFGRKIPERVKEALLLFTGRHPRQKEILDSISVNYVGDEIRDLERAYHNRLTLASMYGYDDEMADAMLDWLRENMADLFSFCFMQGAAESSDEIVDYLWYYLPGADDSPGEIVDLNALVRKVKDLRGTLPSAMVGPRDHAMVGSTINLPFGNLQYHEECLQFRHDPQKIRALMEMEPEKKKHFGSKPKESGHRNELLIAAALNNDREFLDHFCRRVGRCGAEFVSAEAGGRHAEKEESVLGGKTEGKTDVTVRWKDGKTTNISVKKSPAGQVYLVTARNFIAVYEAQYAVTVPSKVRRALAFFIGEDPESRSILEVTDITIDGEAARNLAFRQNCRLMFAVIQNYDPNMATALLSFLHNGLANVFELCFSAGAVKDRGLWSDVIWYKNLADGKSLDYLVSLAEVKAAIQRNLKDLSVCPGAYPGSTIQLPFGHLQYHLKQLEFYQKMRKVQDLLVARP